MNIGSLKPNQGRSWKRLQRIKIVSLLESQFVQDDDIARHLGLTVAAIQAIKKTPEFMAMRITHSTKVISDYEQAIMMDTDIQKHELQSMIPMAFNAIRTALSDPTNPYHIKVAMDLLDRNKATSKVSRMEHSLAATPELIKENKEALELVDILAKQPGESVLEDFRDKPLIDAKSETEQSEADLLRDSTSVKNYRPPSYNPNITTDADVEQLEDASEAYNGPVQ